MFTVLVSFFCIIIIVFHKYSFLSFLPKMLEAIIFTGKNDQKKKIKGKVVLMKKNILDFTDLRGSIIDRVDEFRGRKVFLQLVSAVHAEPSDNEPKGKVGKPADLEKWITKITSLTARESTFNITFDWEEDVGVPGAFLIKNLHHREFYLKTVILEDVPGHGNIHFLCNSWVYSAKKYTKDRIFFSNQTYVLSETPAALLPYREEELENMRGNGSGKLESWDRVYDYAYYNDLGDPDNDLKLARPVLGGSSEFPYPRRGRTGRPPTKKDPESESRLPPKSLDIYVPRDERFGHAKFLEFIAYKLKSDLQYYFLPNPESQFETFQDVLKLFEGGIKIPKCILLQKIWEEIPLKLVKELIRTDGEGLLKYPMPKVIKEDISAWRTDEEFSRELLAGVNPVCIRLLQEFPPKSQLDVKVYGNQGSSITRKHVENRLDKLTIDEAMHYKRIFILDHHDTVMPYLRQINTTTSSKIYATRTLFYLQEDGTLKPLAIELSLPRKNGDHYGSDSKVYTPADKGVEGWIWMLAKAHVVANDFGIHQLISHWLNTHAVIEPFVIATNRQLSVLHPLHKLLQPHFRDTMNINALARQTLINGDGVIEQTVFAGQYAMEMSSLVYKNWNFPEQALPADLIRRGMAFEDLDAPHGLRLLIEDYPYAVDGLEVWSAIKTWVEDYSNFYYKTDDMVQEDSELQLWWKEIREKGHGDKKNEPWWPQLKTRRELVDTCTIIIWVASALHAAVNFGQYDYAGFLPNRPSLCRRFIPEPNSPEYDELKENPEKVYMETITPQLITLHGMGLVEILSRHTSDETYLGQRDNTEWIKDIEPLKAFENFGKKLGEIEEQIYTRNNDEKLKNRFGPVKVPYTLLHPTSEVGLSGKGIPNSVSI